MPIVIEYCDGGVIFKYKLDEYYNSNLKTFLQCIVATGLLNRCSLATSPNETYYNLAFHAESVCTLKEFLLSPMSNNYESSSSSSLSSYDSQSSLEYSDDEKDDFIPSGNLFSYNQALMLIGCLTTQLSALRRSRITLTQLNLNSIFVVNDSIFIMFDPEMITPISPSGIMTFLHTVPVNDTSFCCPEIANRTVVPFNCHCNCVYYSFASMIYYCMFNDYLPMIGDKNERFVLEGSNRIRLFNDYYDGDDNANATDDGNNGNNEVTSSSDDEISIEFARVNEDVPMDEPDSPDIGQTIFLKQCDMIGRLNGTKMHYFLKRCLDPKGDKRKLFYI
jgi:hypothetical protein